MWGSQGEIMRRGPREPRGFEPERVFGLGGGEGSVFAISVAGSGF